MGLVVREVDVALIGDCDDQVDAFCFLSGWRVYFRLILF